MRAAMQPMVPFGPTHQKEINIQVNIGFSRPNAPTSKDFQCFKLITDEIRTTIFSKCDPQFLGVINHRYQVLSIIPVQPYHKV
jgi:hypothetical protein